MADTFWTKSLVITKFETLRWQWWIKPRRLCEHARLRRLISLSQRAAHTRSKHNICSLFVHDKFDGKSLHAFSVLELRGVWGQKKDVLEQLFRNHDFNSDKGKNITGIESYKRKLKKNRLYNAGNYRCSSIEGRIASVPTSFEAIRLRRSWIEFHNAVSFFLLHWENVVQTLSSKWKGLVAWGSSILFWDSVPSAWTSVMLGRVLSACLFGRFIFSSVTCSPSSAS